MRHGLTARKPVLLPGEELDTYAEHLASWIAAVRPREIVELQAANRLAHISLQFERATRAESKMIEDAADAELRSLPESKALSVVHLCLRAIDGLMILVQSGALSRPEGFAPDALVVGTTEALKLTERLPENLDVEQERVDLARTLDAVAATGGRAPQVFEPVRTFATAASSMRKALAARADRVHRKLERKRKELLKTVLPNDEELKKLGRYRRGIQESMQRELETLALAGKVVRSPRTKAPTLLRARDAEVTLRVIR
ncbi:MAG: hypothetical protein JST54_27145 [Deltaproteobacteria bacterium]|nr:hypothetical protein [Deltaproteobacteria bacterium]